MRTVDHWPGLHHYPASRWPALTIWSAVAVAAGAALLTVIYHVGVVAIGRPAPTVLEIYRWEVSIWVPWVVIAPWVVLTAEFIAARDLARAKGFALHAVLASAVIAVHALWFAWVSSRWSPYLSFREFWSAIFAYMRGGFALSLLLYAGLALWASRNQAVIAAESRFRGFFENAVVGIFRSTPDGRFTLLNDAAARFLGYASAADGIRGVNDLSELYVEPAERRRYLDALRRDGFVNDWTTQLRRRDGSVVSISENARGVFDDGVLVAIEGTVRDVTEELAAREALRDSEVRAAELRAQLADAQLHALRLQLQPHFLFNILNTVAMMIRNGDTAQAQQMVTVLGTMFRRFLDLEGEPTVPLEQELDFLDAYLSLEQFRFQDRMEVVRDIDPAALGAPVPTLILQPVAENAVKHGISRMAGKARLELSVRLDGPTLHMELANDTAQPQTSEERLRRGIGIQNTRARLREMYGERASFELVTEPGRVRAIMRIPNEADQDADSRR